MYEEIPAGSQGCNGYYVLLVNIMKEKWEISENDGEIKDLVIALVTYTGGEYKVYLNFNLFRILCYFTPI